MPWEWYTGDPRESWWRMPRPSGEMQVGLLGELVLPETTDRS